MSKKAVYKKYNNSEKGVITSIYNGQKGSSKKRNHEMPKYNKKQLKKWLYENGFYALYCQWVNSNYKKLLKPSIDRVKDSKPYCFDNIILMTWEYNLRKSITKNALNKMLPVSQYKVNGVLVKNFKSIKSASNKTGINKNHISECCSGKRKTSGGYKWSKT